MTPADADLEYDRKQLSSSLVNTFDGKGMQFHEETPDRQRFIIATEYVDDLREMR